MSSTEGTRNRANPPHLTILGFIEAEFQPLRGASKILARLAGCSHRTCERWLRGHASPSARHIERLMAHPKFAENLMREFERQRAIGQ